LHPVNKTIVMDLKERIVENSKELFMQRGCKSVTMDDIAAESGISKRTLYENFEDKNSLMMECLSYSYEKMKTSTDKVFETSTNVYELMFRIHECQSDTRFNMKMAFLMELKKYYPEVYKQFVAKFSKYHDDCAVIFIERGQKEGLIMGDLDNNIVSKAVIAMSDIVNGEIFSKLNASRRQIFKETLLLYVRGISTKKGIELLDNYLNSK